MSRPLDRCKGLTIEPTGRQQRLQHSFSPVACGIFGDGFTTFADQDEDEALILRTQVISWSQDHISNISAGSNGHNGVLLHRIEERWLQDTVDISHRKCLRRSQYTKDMLTDYLVRIDINRHHPRPDPHPMHPHLHPPQPDLQPRPERSPPNPLDHLPSSNGLEHLRHPRAQLQHNLMGQRRRDNDLQPI